VDQLESANTFDRERRRLRSVAYRIVGSLSEADDAVQEAWLRLQRAQAEEIDNLEGWLTTVVARTCLNVLRDRRSHAGIGAATATSRPTPTGSAMRDSRRVSRDRFLACTSAAVER
jgi:DNA-directed RNA polymerase specialized sigma24 family protein